MRNTSNAVSVTQHSYRGQFTAVKIQIKRETISRDEARLSLTRLHEELDCKQRSIVIWTIAQPHIRDCCWHHCSPLMTSSVVFPWRDSWGLARELIFPGAFVIGFFFFVFNHWSEVDRLTAYNSISVFSTSQGGHEFLASLSCQSIL